MLARAACLLARHAEQAHMVRSFAAAAAAKAAPKIDMKLPVAPLQLSGTSGAIATLAWQVAAKENVLAKVQDELYQLVDIFKSHSEIRRLATDPFVPQAMRMKIVREMFATKDVTEVTKRLIGGSPASCGESGSGIGRVDRKLLGGFVLEFEDRLVDMSKAKKLEEFNLLVTKLENDLK
ncbi:ATP synthase subunit O, mitochondrial [Tetrabaena socialis]|uniref:ATP synthase subunit O, mitochondrial n=1 Tax=Tetrabaena socialis TaxID=47790 RepID=A0A2J7ZXT5_9CHLO|nr:ATP synthase subunit O, mitochondrial [Tetrabaena socialis]|eukprot:PNH05079.1 ATP synthase subunit O, mitochondrial [Tetrabaena socialis]